MWATRIRRDGELNQAYYGSAWVPRRDISYVHPASIQMRDAFLRECVLGEQCQHPAGHQDGGKVSGVWWDNPGTLCVSYDAYASDLIAREFQKQFGRRYDDPVKHKPW